MTPAAEEPPAAPIRSLRKPRAGLRTPVSEEKPASKAPSSNRRRAKTPVAEGDDPLDSLPPRSQSPEKGKEAPATGARVRRSARSKVDTIKEEEDEDDLNPPSTDEEDEVKVAVSLPGRTRITRKTTTIPKTVAATTSRATTSRTTRAATGRKVPASEPVKRAAAVTPGDKENTPEADDDEPEVGTSGKAGAKVVSKGKTVRGAAKTRSGGEAAKEPEATKTRASRTRTTTRR